MNNELILLFDLDDTIIVEEQSVMHALFETARIVLAGYSIDPAKFVPTIREKARALWYSLPTIQYSLDIGMSSWEGLWGNFTGDDPNLKKLNALKDEFQFNAWNNALLEYGIKSSGLARELASAFNRIRRSLHTWFPEAEDVLKQLRNNYTMGLITNGAPDIQWEKIKGCHAEQYFDLILISGEAGVSKPGTAIFQMALEFFHKDCSSFIMTGNNLKRDILGAKNAGITSVWINRENESITDDIFPDYQIHSLTELPPLLPGYTKHISP